MGLPGNLEGVNAKIRVYESGTDHLVWFEEAAMFSKQAQQNYYAFDQVERHYGLGARTTVDVTVTFYPSGTVVRKNGVAADTTITIGEDGTNGVVEPPSPSPSDAGAVEGGTSSEGGAGPSPEGDASSSSSGSASGSKGETPGEASGGCGCRVGGERTGDAAGASALLLILAFSGVRRRSLSSRPAPPEVR